MKNLIQNLIWCAVITILLVFGFFYAIDAEVARRDYANNRIARDCIFESNCNHYNELLVKKNSCQL